MSSRPQGPQRHSERFPRTHNIFPAKKRQPFDRLSMTSHRLPVATKRQENISQRAKSDAEGPEEELRPKLDPFINQPRQKPDQPLIRVRFDVSYRCHSRQLICMGGSQFPFGWSFVSIAKLPMTWNPGDRWTAEVYLPLAMRLEYKYVILEEQVWSTHRYGRHSCMTRQGWTSQQNEDSEGVVEITYRSGDVPGRPPDVLKIRKQMAIVDWQPGPNRIIQTPSPEEISQLKAGARIRRIPERPRSYFTFRKSVKHKYSSSADGTWEELFLDDTDGQPVLQRDDIWPNRGTYLSVDDARKFFFGD